MAKLPKNLSSIRARSTSLATKSIDWRKRTSARSGSTIIASMMENGPREKETLEQSIEIILQRIKREQARVKIKQAFVRTPEIEAFLLRKDQVINRLLFNLEVLYAKKAALDSREIKKFVSNPRDHDYVGKDESIVKLEKGKTKPVKERNLAHHRNGGPTAGLPRMKPKTKEFELIEISRKRYKLDQINERKEKLSRLSMAEIVKGEAIRHKYEQKEKFDEIDRQIKEALSDEDFEKMFE